MKILNVCTSDKSGGAAIAAYRLHQGLVHQGVDAFFLAQEKTKGDANVIEPLNAVTKSMKRLHVFGKIERLTNQWYTGQKTIPFSSAMLATPNVLNKIEEIDPDIVHLHWVNRSFLTPSLIAKIKRPLVWSMHDMWAFTGGCHYDDNCGKYQQLCGACPVLNSFKEKDLSRKGFLTKQKSFENLDLTIIGLSNWIMNAAQKSQVFNPSTTRFVNLPNPIDTNVFFPIEKETAKKILGVPTERKLLLFGAMNATSGSRKGFDLLAEAFEKLAVSSETNLNLMIFGASQSEHNFKFPVHFTGHVHDDITKRIVYSAADLMLIPSRQDNLPNTAVEAMACATPVVAFNTGGLADIVDHKVNGYLASPFSVDDFADGIKYILSPDNKHMTDEAHQKVLNVFASDKVVDKYVILYKQLIEKN